MAAVYRFATSTRLTSAPLIDLDLAVDQVNDPINWNAGLPAVDAGAVTILRKTTVGYDNEGDIPRTGMVV